MIKTKKYHMTSNGPGLEQDCYVNAENVESFPRASAPGFTRLEMTSGHSIIVKGTPDEWADLLEE